MRPFENRCIGAKRRSSKPENQQPAEACHEPTVDRRAALQSPQDQRAARALTCGFACLSSRIIRSRPHHVLILKTLSGYGGWKRLGRPTEDGWLVRVRQLRWERGPEDSSGPVQLS